MSIAAAAIGAAGTIGSTLLANAGANIRNQRQRKYQSQLMKEQNDYAVSNWNMQNEYNLPKNQMARFAAAGLNPNLIYGQSNTSGSLGSPSIKAPEMEGPHLSGIASALGNVWRDVLSLQNLKANTEKTKTQSNVNEKMGELLYTRAIGQTLDNEWNKVRNEYSNPFWRFKTAGMDEYAKGLKFENDYMKPSYLRESRAREKNIIADTGLKYTMQDLNEQKRIHQEYENSVSAWNLSHGLHKVEYGLKKIQGRLLGARIANLDALTGLANENARNVGFRNNLLNYFGTENLSPIERQAYQRHKAVGGKNATGAAELFFKDSKYYRYLNEYNNKVLDLLGGKIAGAYLSGLSSLIGSASSAVR